MPDENLLLYLNLTGELFYIITHRMYSQNVKPDLQAQVHNDIALAICNPEVIQRFINGKLRITHYKLHQMKTLLDHIVHSSIMSINDYSLGKLYELTLIATKYQFFACQHPKDILLIVLNHLDTIRKCLTDPTAIQQTKNLHYILIQYYEHQSTCNMRDYLHEIRNYVQEVNLKMTNLIVLKLQRPDGSFVKDIVDDIAIHPECVIPGVIEYTNRSDEITFKSVAFDCEKMSRHREEASLELIGNRVIKLGLSIYDARVISEALPEAEEIVKIEASEGWKDEFRTRKAIQGLHLCSTLLGCDLKSPPMKGNILFQFPTTSTSKTPFNVPDSEHTIETELDESRIKSVNQPVKVKLSYGDINVVRFDARYNRNDCKAALSAIGKEFDNLDSIENT